MCWKPYPSSSIFSFFPWPGDVPFFSLTSLSTQSAHMLTQISLVFPALTLTQLVWLPLIQRWRWEAGCFFNCLFLDLQRGLFSFFWRLLAAPTSHPQSPPSSLWWLYQREWGRSIMEKNNLVTGPWFWKFGRTRKNCFGPACYVCYLLNGSRRHGQRFLGLCSTILEKALSTYGDLGTNLRPPVCDGPHLTGPQLLASWQWAPVPRAARALYIIPRIQMDIYFSR